MTSPELPEAALPAMTDSVSQREPAPPEAEASAFPAPDPPKSITPVEPSALPAVPAPLQSAVSHVQLAFDLAPGARIRITIEDLGPDGHDPSGPATIIHQVVVDPAQAQSVRQTEPVALLTVAPAVVQPVPTAVTLQVTPATPPARAWPPYAEHIRQRLSGWFETGAWRAYLRAALDAQMRDQPLMMALFWLSLGVYTITRFTGLNQFPLYFFSDEAVQTVLAADFVRDGFRDFMGRYFPTYFQNGTYFNLSASVYLQIIPYALFGRSVWVTRGVSVLVALFGAAGVGLALKNIFNVRWWWAGVLLLSITPAWFLHSRTAFETVLLASFYVWFLYFYWLYRLREPRYLFPALFFGALAFYSYKGGQIVVVLTGFCLLLSDLRYHWANRRVGWWGIVFLLVLMLPFLRFVREQPNETFIHLRTLDSYWVNRDLTFPQKLAKFWKEYTFGLSPGYWYFPTNHRDLVRHLMKGYGHILLPTLPLAALGVLVCLRRITSPTHRALLLALLVAPAGGVLAEVGITRVLVFVIPVALLTALGLEMFWEWLPRQWTTAAAPALGAFALLSVVNFGMLRDALVNGPTWYHDYGLGGMQYGAQQVYAEIKDYLRESPQTEVILTPVWTNGADYLQRFFVPDELRVRLDSIQAHLSRKRPLTDDMLFIMIADEYREVVDSGKFTGIQVEQILPYPDGSPGFYFVRLRYSEAADAVFVAEQEARRQLVSEQITLYGETAPVQVRYSRMDAGRIQDLFDNDPFTLARTEEANPAVIELTFPKARTVNGITLTTGTMDVNLIVSLWASADGEPLVYAQTFTGLPTDPTMSLGFDQGPNPIVKLRIEVQNIHEVEPAHIHIREIILN